MRYSQAETQQDQWVIDTLKGKRDGYFVEIGAYDGVTHSNTLALEREFGWTGILVEAVHKYANQCRGNRLEVETFNVTIAPGYGSYTYYVAGQWSGIKELMRPNLLANNVRFGHPTCVVPAVPLAELLREASTPPIIDYLSLDTEGAEYPILEAYFKGPQRSKFRCMTVEIGKEADDMLKLYVLLSDNGFMLEKIVEWEAFFVDPRLL